MKEEKKELSTMGMTQAEFGNALITEAQNRKQKQLLEKSVRVASDLLAVIQDCALKIEHFQKWKKIRESQLEALKKGDFTLDLQGDIKYNDINLNEPISLDNF